MGDLPRFIKLQLCLLFESHWNKDAQRQTRVCGHAHAQPHKYRLTLSPPGRALSSSPGGNDDSHYRLRARLATVPLSAVLLSCPTALLYWCSIISFPLPFEVHQGVVLWRGKGWRNGKD